MTVRTRIAAPLIVLAAVLAACAAPAPDEKKHDPVDVRAASLMKGFGSLERLAEVARKEGTLTIVGLPREWVNFGEVIETFSDRYGVRVQELEPEANSAREIQVALRAKGEDRPAPDVFDLSLEVAVAHRQRFAPYRVQTWQDIPDHMKDHGSRWYAAYGGYLSIGYDARRVPAPASFDDLLKPGYVVALPGDPARTASAFHGVMATSLASAGRGTFGVLGPSGADAERGVRFFARLKRAGNLATPRKPPTVVLDWDYLNVDRAARQDGAWKVVLPREAVLGSFYVQAINKAAPHPAAARLWQEFLFSDEGQNLLLKGFARPARMEALEMRGTIDEDAAAHLPALPAGVRPVFLTIPEIDAGKAHLRKTWHKQIG